MRNPEYTVEVVCSHFGTRRSGAPVALVARLGYFLPLSDLPAMFGIGIVRWRDVDGAPSAPKVVQWHRAKHYQDEDIRLGLPRPSTDQEVRYRFRCPSCRLTVPARSRNVDSLLLSTAEAGIPVLPLHRIAATMGE